MTTRSEKRFFAFLAKVQKSFRQAFGLIRPETTLVWFKKHIQGLWRYPHKTAGRKPLLQSTKKAHPPTQAGESYDALRKDLR
jgi:hypothetical protein